MMHALDKVNHWHAGRAPDITAIEIGDELETALDLFSKIAAKLPKLT
jgi:hypothetical protein